MQEIKNLPWALESETPDEFGDITIVDSLGITQLTLASQFETTDNESIQQAKLILEAINNYKEVKAHFASLLVEFGSTDYSDALTQEVVTEAKNYAQEKGITNE